MALGLWERKKNQSDAFFGSLISNKAVTAYQESSHSVSWLTVKDTEADRYKMLRNKCNGINRPEVLTLVSCGLGIVHSSNGHIKS